MGVARLAIDLDAVIANWRALDALSAPSVQTGAVVKADAYGLGVAPVARALARAGARRFFVAVAEEGESVRKALGPGPQINVLSGHMAGDTALIAEFALTPMLNSLDQITRHLESLPDRPFGVQLDTGMNRLGVSPGEWEAVAGILLDASPVLLMSHLACSDQPGHPMNTSQLDNFHHMTDGMGIPRSLAATAGILLGSEYHFDLTRPGIGLYGGMPFEEAHPVVTVSLPVIQTREIGPGECVGYGATWEVEDPVVRVATVSGGYADGISRYLSNNAVLFAGDVPCPLIGRVSMDLITVDITHLDEVPDALDILCPDQTVNELADQVGTIPNEILTSLGSRYRRTYVGNDA